jgi:citrate lyase subunit beta/citryl-CoA lyase
MFRTLLFIPGNNKKFLDKSKTLSPDIICYDLEDSVPINEKEAARKMVLQTFSNSDNFGTKNTKSDLLDRDTLIFVRVNSFESGLYEYDLKSIISSGLDGIVIPKVNTVEELNKVIETIENLEKKVNLEKIKLIPSIESSLGVVNSYSIASCNSRVIALVFGVFDFLYDMKLDYFENNGIESSYARAKIPVDARAAGISALDSIWQKVDDIDGLIRDANIAKRLGYSGKTIIHPTHIKHVNEIFVPSKNEIEWANKVISILEQIEQKGDKRGALKIEGKMIDAVHFKQAKLILDALKKQEKT